MKFIKNLFVPSVNYLHEEVVDNYNDCIYISTISGKITIDGKTNEKPSFLSERTYATTTSPLYISLGDTENERIKVISSTGNIFIKELKAREIIVESKIGSIVLENCITDKLKLKTKTGNIIAKNIITKDINTESTIGIIEVENILLQNGIIQINNSGSIFFNNMAASENLKLQTRNGKISGKDMAAKSCLITTEGGSIELKKTNFEDVSIYSSNGSIDVEIKKDCNNKIINSENGKVKVKTF